MLVWSASGEGPLPGSCTFLLSPHVVEGPGGLSGASFMRHLISFMTALPL